MAGEGASSWEMGLLKTLECAEFSNWEKIGSGGFGQVYKIWHVHWKTELVIKRPPSIHMDKKCVKVTFFTRTHSTYQNFFDRFMVTQSDIHKGMLQLIGIFALFIAAKLKSPKAKRSCA
ncbi:receptor-interacting serine/threonine-protein kinase 4-like [Lissotriton helveticus]